MCHFQNHQMQSPPDVVYLIRCYLHYVSVFSMTVEGKQLEDLCTNGVLKEGKKLELVSDTEDSVHQHGYNLLEVKERKAAIKLIAAIRQSCLSRIDEEED